MNWSTRLRRWVRISTPPVREASMKPTAATVLPAPVACSNQKRRSAPGSSGASSIASSSSARQPPPSPGAPRRGRAPRPRASPRRWPRRRPRQPRSAGGVFSVAVRAVAVGLVGGRGLLLGHQLGQRARERVDLVRVQLRAVAQLRRLLGEQALQPEQQREVPPPLDRGILGPIVELLQGRVERAAPRRPGRERLRPLAVEQEGLADELRRPLDVGARWNCRCARQLRWSWP